MALLGAGVIAASPIAPPVPAIHLPAIHLDASLVAAVSPIDTYKQVFETARTNLQALVDSADPGEVLKQIVANQETSLRGLGSALGTSGQQLFTALTSTTPDLVKTLVTSLAAGNVEAATNALLTVPLVVAMPLINLLPAIQKFVTQPFQNLLNVTTVLSDPLVDNIYAVGLLGPIISGLGATGAAMQNVIDAVRAGDPQKLVDAIVTGPATILDGVLNGGYGPDLGPLVGPGLTVLAGGILSSGGLSIGPDGGIILNSAGPLATLQTLAHQIAIKLTPPAATTAAAVKTKALPAASSTAESATTDTPAKADVPAKADEDATKAPAAKPVRHTASATSSSATSSSTASSSTASSSTKDGNDTKGDSASSGPKHQHKAEGHGHSAR
ncbi:hypothetical protein ACTXG7_18465 [Mycolicibacterium sp. Dal123E01]|uniref:hypothetical protein n=1 Tax=Mycolicibacterium sp. Dal123E01 TaxID=3457578 RepID=UPI00403EC961